MGEMRIKIKYVDDTVKRLELNPKGDWIDLYAAKDVFVPLNGSAKIPLGVAMQLPDGYEAHVLPRSSTYKTWGIIMTNSMGIIDNTYCGDNDIWQFPAYCLKPKGSRYVVAGSPDEVGSWIRKGDKICQFRVMKKQKDIVFDETTSLGNKDRGGFGSTGKR